MTTPWPAQHRSHIASIGNEGNREIHQTGVAAVDVRLPGDRGVKSAVRVALLTHLCKSLCLPPQHAVRCEAAVFGNGYAFVIHRDKCKAHRF